MKQLRHENARLRTRVGELESLVQKLQKHQATETPEKDLLVGGSGPLSSTPSGDVSGELDSQRPPLLEYTQLQLLLLLASAPAPMLIRDIADQMKRRVDGIGNALRRLRQYKLVEQQKLPTDNKTYLVHITAAGRRQLQYQQTEVPFTQELSLLAEAVLVELENASTPPGTGDLARQLACSENHLSTLLAALFKRGFIQRDPDLNNRRFRALRLTETGAEFLRQKRLHPEPPFS